MTRSQLLGAMARLHLAGMRKAYDEIMSAALKRGHGPQRILGDLLEAEISEKRSRSIKYQMTITKLPLAKELEEFDFGAAEVDEAPVTGSATRFWSAEPEPARRISRSASPAPGSGTVGAAGSSTSSIWPTGSTRKPGRSGRGGWPTRPPDWTS